MSKEKTVAIYAIVLASIAGSVLIFFIFSNKPQEHLVGNIIDKSSENVKWELIQNDLSEIEMQEKVGEIIAKKDFSGCEFVQNELYKKVCINNIALNLTQELQDVSYCQKLDNNLVSIRECEQQVIFSKSIKNEDVNVCKEASDLEIREQCSLNFYPLLAIKKQDVKLCGNIQQEENRNLCYDSYLFKMEFIKKYENFSCQNFMDLQIRKDCLYYQKNYKQLSLQACFDLKSDLFFEFCNLNSLKNRI